MGKKGGIIYLGYRIGECGVGRHWRLSVTITPLIRCMCGSGITLTLMMWGYVARAVDQVLAGRGLRLSGAWCAPIGIGAYQWRWGMMVAVYGVHLLLLGLIGGVWVYGSCWRPAGAVRAGKW